MIHIRSTCSLPVARILPSLFLFGFLGALLLVLVSSDTDSQSSSGEHLDFVFVQLPADAVPSVTESSLTMHPFNRYVEGYRIVLYEWRGRGYELTNLTRDFVSARDPDVSFDGQSILFAGKKNHDDLWQIWRMDRNGAKVTRITNATSDCVSPIHAGALFHLDDVSPTSQFVYVGMAQGEAGREENTALYACGLDGSRPARFTFNLESDFAPVMLPTGRIIFTSIQRRGTPPDLRIHWPLYEINLDGTDLLSFYVDKSRPRFLEMVRIGEDNRAYFIESDQPSWLGGGDLAYVSLRRPLYTHQVLADAKDGWYRDPCPMTGGGLICSVRDRKEGATFSLCRIDPQTGNRQEVLYEDPAWHNLDAHVLEPRPAVHGRSSVVNRKLETGAMYCLNVYQGPGDLLPPGCIKEVRIVEGLPQKSSMPASDGNDPAAPLRIIGIAPVEDDGSFFVEIPAQTPFFFQLLDQDGLVRAAQQTWTWVMPKESRGCIGCHEDRELSPPNRLVKAITHPAVKLNLPPERRRSVDFIHEAAPVLQARCAGASCHGAGGASDGSRFLAGWNPTRETAGLKTVYAALLSSRSSKDAARYVIPGRARDSRLIQILLEASGSNPHPAPALQSLDANERKLLMEWIDLGAAWNSREE